MKSLAAILVLFFQSSAFALISPSWAANSNFKAALDGDSCFSVQDPVVSDKTQKIVVQACSDARASAWQTIISTTFRRDTGYVEFHGPSGAVKPMPITGNTLSDRVAALANIFKTAFDGNPNLNSIMQFNPTDCPYCQSNIVLEMRPRVIQVFLGDVSDPWGQHNKTAQDHFASLLNLQYGDIKVLTTTTKKP